MAKRQLMTEIWEMGRSATTEDTVHEVNEGNDTWDNWPGHWLYGNAISLSTGLVQIDLIFVTSS